MWLSVPRLWRGIASAAVAIACQAAFAADEPAAVTVSQAVSEALANNLALGAERVNVNIADARIVTARLRPNVVVSAGGDHLDLLRTGFTEGNGAGPSEFNLRADQLFERGGKRQSRIAAAEAARSVATLGVQNSARSLTLDVQNAFVDALAAREDLALARQSLESLNRIVEINEERLRAGDLSRVEMIRSRLAALQFQNSVRQADLRLRTALTRLGATLGRANPTSLKGVLGDFRDDNGVVLVDEIRERAMRERPDLLALRQDQARASAELKLQIAGGKSDYTVGTEYRRQQGVNGKSNSLGFFVEAPLRVSDRNQGEIERARQELRQTVLKKQALERSVAAEIGTAAQQYAAARELLERIKSTMIKEARDVREITQYSYQRGEASLLEMLDAQRAFNETMQAYNEARAEYARALYLLDAVSGKEMNR